jgi:hypothetical protein
MCVLLARLCDGDAERREMIEIVDYHHKSMRQPRRPDHAVAIDNLS